MALEDGLVVPVVRSADKVRLSEISGQVKDFAERARDNQLTPGELQGGTFTITNLGNFGIDAFTPIINPPESAILGVGRILKKPVVHKDEVVVRSMLTLSLTFDHRIVDGAPAAQFLQTVFRLYSRSVSVVGVVVSTNALFVKFQLHQNVRLV